MQKWVDYSSKYGLGYLLNSGNVGVHFNDNTKLIQDDAKNFSYYERKGPDKFDTEIKFLFDAVPREVSKKVLIHEQFAKYIQGEEDQSSRQQSVTEGFVRKWVRTQHAILFRLSTQLV